MRRFYYRTTQVKACSHPTITPLVFVFYFLFFYWLKCQLGIDLIPGFHLSAYIPFCWLV